MPPSPRLESRLRDRWIAWRNRRLSDPRFQRWAADFPLTRGIAERRARKLFDLVAGFVYSQTLWTCVRMGLLESLRQGPREAADLARELRLPADSAGRLLRAAAALDLVEPVGGDRYALGAQGAALVGNPGLAPMIEHHRLLYADLGDGVDLLRRGGGGGALAAYWPYATAAAPERAAPAAVADYSTLMAASLPSTAEDIFRAYDLRRHRRLMDVGGGEGAFLTAVGARAPGLELTLFDLPAVTGRAEAALGRAGLLPRTRIIAGDFLSEPLPGGCDIITLVRILHDHDDTGVRTLLRSARAALPADGALLVAEPMSAAPRADLVADVYFAFYLLAMGRGRARSPAEIGAFLREAGFRRVEILKTRTPFLLRAILARP